MLLEILCNFQCSKKCEFLSMFNESVDSLRCKSNHLKIRLEFRWDSSQGPNDHWNHLNLYPGYTLRGLSTSGI